MRLLSGEEQDTTIPKDSKILKKEFPLIQLLFYPLICCNRSNPTKLHKFQGVLPGKLMALLILIGEPHTKLVIFWP
jgi:hypothetical protein